MLRTHRIAIAWTLLAVATGPVTAQSLPRGTPESVGLSTAGLARATAALQEHVDRGDVAGVVAAVVRRGRLVYFEALGMRDIESNAPMPADAIFRLYSMTRPITSLAALMLHEEGRLSLDDRVSAHLPEMADMRVFLDAEAPDVRRTRPASREMTVEDLIRFTSGLGSRSAAVYREHGVRSRADTLERFVEKVAAMPLFEDPRTRWRYGIATTVLGRVVEVASGLALDEFLRDRIFAPLGMRDAAFWVPPPKRDRLATVYRPDDRGRLRPHAIEDVPFTERPALFEGVGLVSSTMDYLRFCQMLLDGGALDGVRLVTPDTVRLMATNQVPADLLPIGFGRPMLGYGWSLGFAVVMDRTHFDHTVSDGEFWWDGSAGTRFWIDPSEEMVTIVMAQVSPARGNGFRERFKTLVYDAIVD